MAAIAATETAQRFIVTGASSGIGQEVARHLLRGGASVALVARNESALSEIASEYTDTAHVIVADVTKSVDCENCVKEAVEKLGGLDCLINNAGILGGLGNSVETTSLDDWASVLRTNLRAPFYLTQLCVPALSEAAASGRDANVLNVSSLAATRAFPNMLPYCVSKAGLDQLTKCTALELAPKKIRVNAVNPATVVTDIHLRGGMEEDAYQAYLKDGENSHPIGRVGQTADIAELVGFITSSKASWMTGACVPIDGGRSLVCSGGKQLFGGGDE